MCNTGLDAPSICEINIKQNDLQKNLTKVHDLEVTNLDLSKREFDLLATKLNHNFKSDALTTLAYSLLKTRSGVTGWTKC